MRAARAKPNLLIEDVPGVGKTKPAKALAHVTGDRRLGGEPTCLGAPGQAAKGGW